MARRDVFHGAVRRGLEKEECVITHDPLLIEACGTEVAFDMGAENLFGA